MIMIKPSFIPSPEIRQLRDLIRYRFKLTNMLWRENHTLNCQTVSKLKLEEVFSDAFGKSARSITQYILDHPSEAFVVATFVDGRCKTPTSELQTAVDEAFLLSGQSNSSNVSHTSTSLKHTKEISSRKS